MVFHQHIENDGCRVAERVHDMPRTDRGREGDDRIPRLRRRQGSGDPRELLRAFGERIGGASECDNEIITVMLCTESCLVRQ